MVALAYAAAAVPRFRAVGLATFELRPLTTGEILDGSLTLLRRHFRLLFGIAVACEGVPAALDVYVDLAGRSGAHPGLALLGRLLNLIGTLLVTGATVRAVSEAYLGRVPRLGDALRYAGSKLGVIFGATFASGVVVLLATIALVIPGIIVFCGYSVAGQVAALEPLRSSTDALRRSWDLTKGFKGKGLVLWVVAFALIAVVVLAVGFAGGIATGLTGGVEAPVTALLAVITLLIYPLISCVFTLFYYDLRVRKEGFDLEVLSGQLGIAPTP
ncbi:MAG TPA: hypothetical protein VK531_05075 [Gemmatimonadales bacterium]|nr:hypothetical protein [Gemmatimonadales bacterium]